MKNIKKYMFLSLCAFLIVCFMGTANAGRETLDNPPQQINMQSGDSPWAFRIESAKRPNGVRRYEIKPDGSIALFDASGVTRYRIDSGGTTYTYNASGTLQSYEPVDKIVYIDNTNDLFSFSGQAATSGQSYFRTEPGKTYIVDLSQIANTGGSPSGTTLVAMGQAWSGITAILPDASVYSGPMYDVTIINTVTGGFGWTSINSGATKIYVAPYCSSTTAYYQSAPYQAQTMQTFSTSASGATIVNIRLASGATFYEIDRVGESATFRLHNGSVSAYPVRFQLY